MNNKEFFDPNETKTEHPVQSLVSALALAMLEETLAKGGSIHIPSLGITIHPDGTSSQDEVNASK